MRYRAFISYASADRVVGERFQRAIEHYRLPRPLRGMDHGYGAVPKRLTPLFRDRSDASAGRDLGVTLRTALESSDALVVLCSPASARSKWVNEEIRTFKRLGRNARIFPVLIAGTSRRHDPVSAPDGAFPPALFERFDIDGMLLPGEDATPLAPDLREHGDGQDFAKLKVVAALTGVPLTLLTQRQQEAERREKLIVRWVAAVMAFLAVLASAAAVQAWRSAEDARARLGDAIEMASRRVDDAATYQDAYGVPSAVVRQLLVGAEHDFDELIGARAARTPVLDLQRGRLSVLFSGLYGTVGDSERELALARAGLAQIEAVTTQRRFACPSTWLTRLPRLDAVAHERLAALEALGNALADSEDGYAEAGTVFERGRQLAVAERSPAHVARFWSLIGVHRYDVGDLDGALAAQTAAIAALDRAIAEGGSDALDALRRERALARSDRAEMLLELERHSEALAEQSAAVSAFQAEAATGSDDAAAQLGLAQALVRHEDMRYAVSGDWRQSTTTLERAIRILQDLRDSDPARIDYARSLSIALERLGDAQLQLGDLDGSAQLFGRAIALKREILARDPRSADAQRDVAVALERQGELALARARPRDALPFLDEALALRTRAGDGSDAVLTRDLAVQWSKTGQVRANIGGTQDWAGAYRHAIALMRPLTEQDGAPPGWLRDLAVFHFGYGEALARAGRRGEAVTQWNAALRLTERQLALNPADPRLRNDATVLRQRIGASK